MAALQNRTINLSAKIDTQPVAGLISCGFDIRRDRSILCAF
ncbi:hypothetical protein R2A130_1185 [Ahrensia sp. R2A130]|nr:hypothetical protein R2A130_1185 [Ahrensia sp. R2A130]